MFLQNCQSVDNTIHTNFCKIQIIEGLKIRMKTTGKDAGSVEFSLIWSEKQNVVSETGVKQPRMLRNIRNGSFYFERGIFRFIKLGNI